MGGGETALHSKENCSRILEFLFNDDDDDDDFDVNIKANKHYDDTLPQKKGFKYFVDNHVPVGITR